MANANFDEQARLRRKKAIPALIAAGSAFFVFFKFSGFNLGAILSLVILVMILWYMITIRKKLERWANEKSSVDDASKREREAEVRMESDQGVLGDVDAMLDEESEQWILCPRGSGKFPTIALAADWDQKAGRFLLNAGLRDEALRLSKKMYELEAEVSVFLKREALRPELKQYSESIRKLEMEQVSLLWADQPTDGVIHFKVIESDYNWMCKVHHGKLIERSLGFDT